MNEEIIHSPCGERIENCVCFDAPVRPVLKKHQQANDLGARVMDFVIRNDLISAIHCDEHASVLVWSANAAEQIGTYIQNEMKNAKGP